MSALALSPDVYGSFARFSAVADFLELRALRSPQVIVREPDLERRIETDGIRLSSPLGPSASDSAQAAGIVFEVFEERARILGMRYPFHVSRRNGLRRSTKVIGGYRVLLAMTAAHAYRVKCGDPKKLFEGLVTRALEQLGLRSATTGTSRKQKKRGFTGMLEAACNDVGLEASPDGSILSEAAQDEKVDTLAHLDLGDGRSGRWTFIGQATIAESGEWERKASEPKPKLWRALIGDTHDPSPFLAVPYHVEANHLDSLHARLPAVVLDRLRLAATGLTPSKEERALVAAVDACRVEW